eukprot:4405845-Pyramimonas_sp.AAC.1
MNDQGPSWHHLQYLKGCALCCRLPGLSHIVAMTGQFWGFRGPSCGLPGPPSGALLGPSWAISWGMWAILKRSWYILGAEHGTGIEY